MGYFNRRSFLSMISAISSGCVARLFHNWLGGASDSAQSLGDSLLSENISESSVKSNLRSRHEFAEAMSKLKEGMPASEVEKILGPPEDRLEKERDKISLSRTTEIWCYGTNGHRTTATLGSVAMEGGRVQYIWGGRDSPPPKKMFTEKQLREILRALDQVPSYNDGQDFDPIPLIRAVNLLQPLGKQKSLAAMRELVRISNVYTSTGREGLFLVMRALFEVPVAEGRMPQMFVGAMSPSPKDKSHYPRFPVIIVDDVPLLAINGVMLAGRAQSPVAHIKYFETNGTVRADLLKPGSDPMGSLIEFIDSDRWTFDKDVRGRDGVDFQARLLQQQVIRALETVYQVPFEVNDGTLPYNKKLYQKLIDEVLQMDFRWDKKQQRYTKLDGSSLKLRRRNYPNHVWRPKNSPHHCKYGLNRLNPLVVEVDVSVRLGTMTIDEEIEFKVVELESGKVLCRSQYPFKRKDLTPNATYGTGLRFKAAEGVTVQMVWKRGSEVEKSGAITI